MAVQTSNGPHASGGPRESYYSAALSCERKLSRASTQSALVRGHARGVSPEMNSRHAAPRGGADAGGIGCVDSACVALAAEAVAVCVGGGVSI